MSDDKKKVEAPVDQEFQSTKQKEHAEFSEAFEEIKDGDPKFKKDLDDDNEHIDKEGDKKGTALIDTKEVDDDPVVVKIEPDAPVDNTDGTADDVDKDLFKAPETDKPKVSPEIESLKAENATLSEQIVQLEQKMASWEGRIKKANERADEAEARAKGNVDADATKLVADNPEVLQKFFADFPEFEAPLKMLIEQSTTGVTMDEVLEKIQPKLDKVDEIEDKVDAQPSPFVVAVEAVHKDATVIFQSGKLLPWITSQKEFIRPTLQRIYDNGTVEEIITLLSEFKRTTGYDNTTNKSKAEEDKKKKLESMLTVGSDDGGPPAGEADKSDYEAAAKEAFAE